MLRAALIWALTALPVAADKVEDRLEAAFATWLEENGTTGRLGVGVRDGTEWHVSGAGVSGELASVSKSITASCALMLVDDGTLAWSDTVADRLGKGPEATVAQLVTHSSGLVRDGTQVAMPFWLDRPTGQATDNARAVLDIVAARGAPTGTPGEYAYNNENYALLALMIEEASGLDYYDTCWSRLDLAPGIAASPRSVTFGPWGGLVADAGTYLAFLQYQFGPGSRMWDDPFAYPHVPVGGGAYYGLGMLFRPFGDGYNFWHFGALCFPERLKTGSFAVMWGGKVSALALYDACVDWDAMVALDNAFVGAVYKAPQ